MTKSFFADSKHALRDTRNLSDLSFLRSQGRCRNPLCKIKVSGWIGRRVTEGERQRRSRGE